MVDETRYSIFSSPNEVFVTCSYYISLRVLYDIHVISTYKWWVCELFTNSLLWTISSCFLINTNSVRSSVGTVFVYSFPMFVCCFPDSQNVKASRGVSRVLWVRKGSSQLVRHFLLARRKFVEKLILWTLREHVCKHSVHKYMQLYVFAYTFNSLVCTMLYTSNI